VASLMTHLCAVFVCLGFVFVLYFGADSSAGLLILYHPEISRTTRLLHSIRVFSTSSSSILN